MKRKDCGTYCARIEAAHRFVGLASHRILLDAVLRMSTCLAKIGNTLWSRSKQAYVIVELEAFLLRTHIEENLPRTLDP